MGQLYILQLQISYTVYVRNYNKSWLTVDKVIAVNAIIINSLLFGHLYADVQKLNI